MPLNRMHWGHSTTHPIYLPQMPNLDLTVRNYQTNSICGAVHKQLDWTPQICQDHEGDVTNNGNLWPQFCFSIKKIIGITGKNPNKVRVVLHGNFQVYHRRPLFLKVYTRERRDMGHHVSNLFSKGLKKEKQCVCVCVGGMRGVREKEQEGGREREWWSKCGKMLISGESGGRAFRISLYCACNFSISLKLCPKNIIIISKDQVTQPAPFAVKVVGGRHMLLQRLILLRTEVCPHFKSQGPVSSCGGPWDRALRTSWDPADWRLPPREGLLP